MLGTQQVLARKWRDAMRKLPGWGVVAGAAAALGLASMSLADPPGGPHFGSWGFDLSGRDTTISPGADFYGYANGTYVKQLVIPPDRSRYGNFDALTALSEDRV